MAKSGRIATSLSARVWKQIELALKQARTRTGAPTKLSDRQFLEALLHRAASGCSWRELPAQFGDWNAVYQRYRRWRLRGIWRQLKDRLPPDAAQVIDTLAKQESIRPSPLKRRAKPKPKKVARPKRR